MTVTKTDTLFYYESVHMYGHINGHESDVSQSSMLSVNGHLLVLLLFVLMKLNYSTRHKDIEIYLDYWLILRNTAAARSGEKNYPRNKCD